MSDADTLRRVLLAVTETSPIETLWQSLIEAVEGDRAEVVTVFVCERCALGNPRRLGGR